MTTAPPVGAVRVATIALWACAALALANLPLRDFPPGWLFALCAPGVLLGLLPRTDAHFRRALLAMALQSLALWLALQWAGTLSRPAALACTILPPLAFVTARQQDTDGALGLFLSFCVLLVGVILDGVHAPLVVGYGLAACLALRATALLAACRVGRPAPAAAHRRPARHLAASALALAVPCLFAALAVDGAIGLAPSPSRIRQGAGDDSGAGLDTNARRHVGIDDSFVLDGGGALSDLIGERLVRVRSATGDRLPADLYLRSAFFAAPGLDQWRIGGLEARAAESGSGHVLRRPLAGAPVHWLEVERFAGARGFVFAPPGTIEVQGVDGLAVDAVREWLRQVDGRRQGTYAVAYQRLPLPRPGTPIDGRAPRLGLLSLPASLDRRPFERLLAEWRVGSEPREAALAIAEGLASHCRYDRVEPTGPYAHALQNFLFADGDRHGYCMHFASAAALMLRLRGVACRIGVGLYGGEADRDEPGARVYGSQHAHAWVEIPFAGRGYVVFDPTPPAERGQRAPTPAERDEPAATSAPAATAPAIDPWRAVVDFVLQPWLLLGALLLALASTLWPARRAPAPALPTPPVARSARRLLARLLRALAAAGLPRRRGQTLERFAHELQRDGRLLPEFTAAFTAYQEVRFGGRPFDAPRERSLRSAVEAAERLRAETASAAAAGQT